MGPRAGWDAVAKRKIPTAGNRTPIVESVVLSPHLHHQPHKCALCTNDSSRRRPLPGVGAVTFQPVYMANRDQSFGHISRNTHTSVVILLSNLFSNILDHLFFTWSEILGSLVRSNV
jgi:hypothetical protein